MKTNLYNSSNLKEYRRHLRNECTFAEHILWQQIKTLRPTGHKFRRQYSAGPYIVDFYCPSARLAIELDGEVHYSIEASEYDERRTRYLKEELNITVIRFENCEVIDNPEGVMKVILEKIEEMKE